MALGIGFGLPFASPVEGVRIAPDGYSKASGAILGRRRVIEWKALLRAMVVGTVLQVVMYVVGHFSSWFAVNVFGFGGMMISAIAGYIYAMDTGHGYFPGATGGAIAGGACGFVGIGVSVVLGETVASFIATGTAIAVMIGAIGGLFGQMAANLRAMEK